MKELTNQVLKTYVSMAQNASNNLEKAKYVGCILGAAEIAFATKKITEKEYDEYRNKAYSL